MKVIRTFVAVLIDDRLRENIAVVQNEVKKLAPDVKWVAPENFHVTLKFLGNVPEDSLSQVYAAVQEAVLDTPSFNLSLSGVGAFPNPSRPRVVWVGIEDGRDQLSGLARALDKSLSKLGFEKDDKPFKAHITIGRAKDGRPNKELADGIGNIDAGDLGTQRVLSVAVMQSELLREGPVYSPLSLVKLGGAA